MFNFHSLAENFLHPPVLFFFLGVFAMAVKSDLEIPPAISRFLTLYLLLHIGFTGGVKLFANGIDSSVLIILGICMVASFVMPLISYQVLKIKLDNVNAGALAATYGSISAVTFATAATFLESEKVGFGGYMVAAMALMESPAIISGLYLIAKNAHKGADFKPSENKLKSKMGKILHEAFTNGSVLLLLGSLAIGYTTGLEGAEEMKPFVSDIYKGFLSLYMLDMGITAGKRIGELRRQGPFLIAFGILYPIVAGTIGILLAVALGLSLGDALLFTILFASASYIAVPAAMRLAAPTANMSILLPMALGVTFTFNIALGIPIYYFLLKALL
jgi:hypothetical protein